MEEQQIGLGLTPLALQAVLQHLTPQTKTSLLRCSRAVRHEVLMSAEALSFAPRSSSRSQLRHRSKQLCDVLRQRTEPFHLTLDLRQGPKGAELAALLSEVAGTSRPVRNGSPTCCVEKLVIWGMNALHKCFRELSPDSLAPESTQGWGHLLGAAFPRITTLDIPDSDNFCSQLDIPLLSGLAACSRLTSLNIPWGRFTEPLINSAQLLPAWLPHVHTLKGCTADAQGTAVVGALAPQLRHLNVSCALQPHPVAPALAACTQLVSVAWTFPKQEVMDVLLALPSLREMRVVGFEDLSTPAPAQCSVQSITTDSLDLGLLHCLPLASLQHLQVKSRLVFRLQPDGPVASGAAMHDACTALTQVPQLQLPAQPLLRLTNRGPYVAPEDEDEDDEDSDEEPEGEVAVWPDECAPHVEATLAGLQPLAHVLGPSLCLTFKWLGSGGGEVGREVLRGLHAAYGGAAPLTQLSIFVREFGSWEPMPDFWAALPDTLSQLQTLELHQVGDLDHGAVVAACRKLARAGRHLDLVMCDPVDMDDVMDVLERKLLPCAPHVHLGLEFTGGV